MVKYFLVLITVLIALATSVEGQRTALAAQRPKATDLAGTTWTVPDSIYPFFSFEKDGKVMIEVQTDTHSKASYTLENKMARGAVTPWLTLKLSDGEFEGAVFGDLACYAELHPKDGNERDTIILVSYDVRCPIGEPLEVIRRKKS